MREQDGPEADSRLAFAIICLGSFLAPLLVHSSTLGIPTMSEDLDMDARAISWFPLALVVGNAVAQFPAGKLGDMFGHNRVFVLGLLIAAAASLMGGIAINGTMVTAARFMQGVGNAAIFATAMALISNIYSAELRGAMTGIYVAIGYLGVTGGPLFGGLLIEPFGWRSVFLIPVIFFIIAAIAGYHRLPSKDPQAADVGRFDFAGTLLYSLAIAIIASSMLRIKDYGSSLALLLGLVILGVFVVHQRRKLHPLIDFGLLLESRAFGFACLILVFLQGAIYAVPFVATLYLQYIQALSPQTTGFVLMLQAVSTAVIALFSGRLIGRVSSIQLIGTGIGVGLAGFLLIIFANGAYAFFLIPLGLVAIGICAGLVETPTINFMMGCVAGHQRGSASAAVNSARMFGSLIGISAISVLLSLTIGDAMITPAVYDALGLAVRDYFLIASVMILLCGASLFLARRSA